MSLSDELKFAFPSGEMESWLVLGAVTHGNVRAWVRLPGSSNAPVRLCIDGAVVVEAEAHMSSAHDHVGVVDLEVPPGYAGRRAEVEAAGMTRLVDLAPADDAREAFSFWFGSCNQPYDDDGSHTMEESPRAGIYRAVLGVAKRHEARFGLLLGDQMYADEMPQVDVRAWANEHPEVSDAELLDIYRQLYRGYFNQPGVRALQEAIPAFLIWDDHEIFNSYGAQLELSELDHRIAGAAFEAYREYQHARNPGATLSDEPPFHYSFWYAGTGFFMLDLRSERNYQEERVIGQEQWTALGAFLEEAGAREVGTVFIGCSIPVVHFSPAIVRLLDRLPGHEGDNTRDRWDAEAFEADRARLVDMVCDWQGANPRRSVAILSGDVHAGAAFSVSRKGPRGGEFVQWTSSALSSPGGVMHTLANRVTTRPINFGNRQADARRLGIEPRNNFGIVEVVPRDEGRGHRLSLSIYGYDPKRRRAARSIHHRLD